MSNDYIDVDFTETTEDKTQTPDINISADPLSALITTIGTVGKSITEYKMCKQHEETKRSQIKANLKIGLEQIHTQKEICLKMLDNQQKLNIMFINEQHEITMQTLDVHLDAIKSAIEIAKETKDFSTLIDLMKINNDFIQMRSEFTLKLMDKTNNSLLPQKDGITGYLE